MFGVIYLEGYSILGVRPGPLEGDVPSALA